MEVRKEDPPVDPDAQATVTDFLDYTEYLPSDLTRSLTLIHKLDDICVTTVDTVHELTKKYGSLPETCPTKQSIRHDISYNLDHAISCREFSYGEVSRLSETVNRHYNRLTSIISELHAMPKPPSRDPTSVPRSPKNSRKTPLKIPEQPPPPSAIGTNVHSAVAGCEMAKLRKRTKKNASRTPSEDFMRANSLGLADTNLSDKAMALNIDNDILASEVQKLGHRLDSLKNIFAPPPEKPIEGPTLGANMPAKKRKREESADQSAQ